MTRLTTIAAVLALSTLLPAAAARAQYTELARIGLSAAADAYVDSMEAEVDAPFTLEVIAVGPEGTTPLPFAVSSLQWAVFSTCCGGAAGFVGFEPDPAVPSEGHPLVSVVSTPPSCLETDLVHLGRVTFLLQDTEPGDYLMVAGATGFALDCDGGEHLMMDLAVTVTLTGDMTGRDDPTWGRVKSLFR